MACGDVPDRLAHPDPGERLEDLKSKGVEFWTEPLMVKLKSGKEEGFVCCTDPDGTVIELIQV